MFEGIKNYFNAVTAPKDYSDLKAVLTERNKQLIENGYQGFDVDTEIKQVKSQG